MVLFLNILDCADPMIKCTAVAVYGRSSLLNVLFMNVNEPNGGSLSDPIIAFVSISSNILLI